MSYERFLELPDELRAEYVDGEAIGNPPPSFRHQMICLRLRDLLIAQLGGEAVVALDVGWRVTEDGPVLRIPDVVVLHAEPVGDLVTDAPRVVVEVLSTNRRHDLVRKSTEYLAAGAGQYWIVDPRDRGIGVYSRADGGWVLTAEVTDASPSASFDVPPFGIVTLNVTDVLEADN